MSVRSEFNNRRLNMTGAVLFVAQQGDGRCFDRARFLAVAGAVVSLAGAGAHHVEELGARFDALEALVAQRAHEDALHEAKRRIADGLSDVVTAAIARAVTDINPDATGHPDANLWALSRAGVGQHRELHAWLLFPEAVEAIVDTPVGTP